MEGVIIMMKKSLHIHTKNSRVRTIKGYTKNMTVAQIAKDKTVSRTEEHKITYKRVPHIYKTKEGTWRGFVTPYNVTFEASSRKKVEEVLPEMVKLYEAGLEKYNYPSHLMKVPLSYQEDIEEFNKLLG